MPSIETLFRDLIEARTSEEVRLALTRVGNTPDTDIRSTFGPLQLRWEPFGDNLSNISSIGLGTKPGRSLTERLTNAIDAILEDRASTTLPAPESSRAAAQQWFGRPVTGPDDGLYKWKYEHTKYDRLINVVLLPSGVETAPTIDVIDAGVGLAASAFRRTILSLQAGNKLTKRYLIGAFAPTARSKSSTCGRVKLLQVMRGDG